MTRLVEVYRTGERFVDEDGHEGKRLRVVVNLLALHGVERGEGYKWLRPGLYECEMAHKTSADGSKTPAIRVLGDYSKGRIYLHWANRPGELDGCQAPGMRWDENGVQDSRPAMRAIFKELGGFVEGRRVDLRVVGE